MTDEQWDLNRGLVHGAGLQSEARLTEHYKSYDPFRLIQNAHSQTLKTVKLYLDCGDKDFRNDGYAALHILLLCFCNGATTGYSLPHHPSQLYEFFLEGVVLFVVLWWFSRKPRPRMAVSGLFALLYGVFRFIVEFVRLPDVQLDYLAFGWLTMGQVLSLPLILTGMLLFGLACSRKNNRLRQTSTSQN